MKKKRLMPSISIFIMIVLFFSVNVYGQDTTIKASHLNDLGISFKSIIEDYILPLSAAATLISIILGIYYSYQQYRLKVASEIRLRESAKAENDVKVLNLFTTTFDIAHSRKNTIVSEKIIEKLFDKGYITSADFASPDQLSKKLEMATRTIPVGLASQVAAISAIGQLGADYEILKEPALQGLKSFKEQVQLIPAGQNRMLTHVTVFIDDAIRKLS